MVKNDRLRLLARHITMMNLVTNQFIVSRYTPVFPDYIIYYYIQLKSRNTYVLPSQDYSHHLVNNTLFDYIAPFLFVFTSTLLLPHDSFCHTFHCLWNVIHFHRCLRFRSRLMKIWNRNDDWSCHPVQCLVTQGYASTSSVPEQSILDGYCDVFALLHHWE